MSDKAVTIVSGLPRSGTSMMMRMLQAGGMELLTDDLRTADEDNPRGYFEYEPVKSIEDDQTWLGSARGRAVKMISALLRHLPPGYHYRVIFMRRDIQEILASQRQMLLRRGEDADAIDDERMATLFAKHVESVELWLAQQHNFEVLYVPYREILSDPIKKAQAVNAHLGGELRVEQMAYVVDSKLYRQRQV